MIRSPEDKHHLPGQHASGLAIKQAAGAHREESSRWRALIDSTVGAHARRLTCASAMEPVALEPALALQRSIEFRNRCTHIRVCPSTAYPLSARYSRASVPGRAAVGAVFRGDMQNVSGLERLLFATLDRCPTNLIRGACLSADDLTPTDYDGCAAGLHDKQVRLCLVQIPPGRYWPRVDFSREGDFPSGPNVSPASPSLTALCRFCSWVFELFRGSNARSRLALLQLPRTWERVSEMSFSFFSFGYSRCQTNR